MTEYKENTSKLDSVDMSRDEMDTILAPYRVRTIPRDSTEGKRMVGNVKTILFIYHYYSTRNGLSSFNN